MNLRRVPKHARRFIPILTNTVNDFNERLFGFDTIFATVEVASYSIIRCIF
jgi:hypothetical protein